MSEQRVVRGILLEDGEIAKYDYNALANAPTAGKKGTAENSEIFNDPTNEASGRCSHAEGLTTKAKGNASHAEGESSIAYTTGSHAEGKSTKAGGKSDNDTNGAYSHAEGVDTVAYGRGSHAEGESTLANNQYSHAEGGGCQATGDYSHAEGCNNGDTKTIASALGSHAEGRGTSASGNGSHSEGESTIASGIASHAEGGGCFASGDYSHAEGCSDGSIRTTAYGKASHAEGIGTWARGSGSHTEGKGTATSKDYAHAEGVSTTASGIASHAEGNGTISTGNYQHTQGKYNVEDTKKEYAHIVGGGSSNSDRKNIHTVDWTGRGWFANGLKIGGTNQNDPSAKEVATKSDIVQPDWNQSNPTAPDYIQNRTHYEEEITEPVTLQFMTSYENNTIYELRERLETAKFTVNGKECVFVANADGTVNYAFPCKITDGENVYTVKLNFHGDMAYGWLSSVPVLDTTASVTYLRLKGTVTHKLDAKYLPEIISSPYVIDSEAYTYGDDALTAILKGRPILIKVPNKNGNTLFSNFMPVLQYQLPNQNNNYLVLFYLKDGIAENILVAMQEAMQGNTSAFADVFGVIEMMLSQSYSECPLKVSPIK